MLYEIHNKCKIDSAKKNLMVFLLENVLKKDMYTVTYQYVFNTMEILSRDFNIVVVSKNRGSQWLKHYLYHPVFGKYTYIEFDKDASYSKSTAQTMPLDHKISYINSTFEELKQKDGWLLENLAGTL